MTSYPQVMMYHPRIGIISPNGKMYMIQADLPDFMSDDEVLSTISKNLKARTAGDIVKALRSKHKRCSLNCSMRHVANHDELDAVSVYEWHTVCEKD